MHTPVYKPMYALPFPFLSQCTVKGGHVPVVFLQLKNIDQHFLSFKKSLPVLHRLSLCMCKQRNWLVLA